MGVSKKGKITAKAEGNAVITVKAMDGSNKKAKVNVTVTGKGDAGNTNTDTNTGNDDIAATTPGDNQGTAPEQPGTITDETTNSTGKDPAGTTGNGSAGSISGGGASFGGSTGTGGSSSGTNTPNVPEKEKTVITVKNYQELKEALSASPSWDKIIYNSNAEESIEIASEKTANTELVVNAPKATITNTAKFKNISIEAIAENTWVECASGNMIDILARNAHLLVRGGSVEALQVLGNAENIHIENEGSIRSIEVATPAALTITGSNHTRIPVEIAETAANARVRTSIPVTVEASAALVLQLLSGADRTTSVTIANISIHLTIQGLGVIPVTNRQDNTVNNVVAVTNPEIVDPATPGAITGTVKKADADGTSVLSGASVYMIPYKNEVTEDNVEAALAEAVREGTCHATETSADGKYEISELNRGNYVLIVKEEGLLTYIQTVTLNMETYQNDEIILVDESNATGSVEGTLVDAISGNVHAELLLTIRRGSGNLSGEAVATTRLNAAESTYQFENLPIGTYTVEVTDTRQPKVYSNANFTVTILPYRTVTKNMTISRVDTQYEGQLQFILRWLPEAEDDSVSSDLDSHLVGPGVGEDKLFHTYYSDEEYYVNGERYADLDRDDTTYEGPETTTVRKEVDGIYHFYIHDFSDGSRSNRKLTTSRPTVDVYIGSTLLQTFVVPDGIGNVWDVCTYDTVTDTLTPVNEIYYHPGSAGQIGEVEKVKELLQEMIQELANMEGAEAVLQEARTVLESSNDYRKVVEMLDRLYGLQDALKIAYIDFPGKEDYDIDDGSQISTIELIGREPTLPADLQITLASVDSSYIISDSDKEGYVKVITVKNHVLNIAKQYYVSYKEYVPSLLPNNVKAEGNCISDWEFDYDDNEQGEEIEYIYISGLEDTLGNPVFTYNDSEIQSTYQPLENDETYTGKLTVTYRTHTKIYFIKYRKDEDMNLLPRYAYYLDEDEDECSVSMGTDSVNGKILLYNLRFTHWDTLYFEGRYEEISYQINTEANNTYTLSVKLGNRELHRYPIVLSEEEEE